VVGDIYWVSTCFHGVVIFTLLEWEWLGVEPTPQVAQLEEDLNTPKVKRVAKSLPYWGRKKWQARVCLRVL